MGKFNLYYKNKPCFHFFLKLIVRPTVHKYSYMILICNWIQIVYVYTGIYNIKCHKYLL